MPSEPVQPLRINKSTLFSSPSKMESSSATQGPLSEISPMERRRNSPRFDQTTKRPLLRDSSSFDPSTRGNSPRHFWHGQEPTSASRFGSENAFDAGSIGSPHRRSSIENLKKASRVKNSSMYAREQKNEYDPTSSPLVERPLAAGRPLSTQLQGNAYGGQGLEGLRKKNGGFKGHRRGESSSNIPLLSPSKVPTTSEPGAVINSTSSRKEPASPTRTSVTSHEAKTISSDLHEQGNPEHSQETYEKPPAVRTIHRNTKSVTFDAAPPQINEYEMVTPDPSSVASGSRESSYDSIDEFEYESGAMGRGAALDVDDSFDASLEDTEKTPVVLPEDWRHMSPATADVSLAHTFDDPFESPDYGAAPATAQHSEHDITGSQARKTSSGSDEEARPLPPLPGACLDGSDRRKRDSSIGLATTAERLSGLQRSLPFPPSAASVSKSEILGMRDSSMTLEDRLCLMGLRDESDEMLSKQSRENQPLGDSPTASNPGLGIHVDEDKRDQGDSSVREGFSVPHISRESILRKVQSRTFSDEGSDGSLDDDCAEQDYSALARLDPDVPIPSREIEASMPDSSIKQEEDLEDTVDMSSIPELHDAYDLNLGEGTYTRQESVIRKYSDNDRNLNGHDDDESRYSSPSSVVRDYQTNSDSTTEDEGPPTPTQRDFTTPAGTTENVLAPGLEITTLVPEFESFLSADDFNLDSLRSYMSTPPPHQSELDSSNAQPSEPASEKVVMGESHRLDHGFLSRNSLGLGFDRGLDRGTPDSVIRRSTESESPKRDSITVPEPVATIKAPGSKLKTRPSATPHDMAAMAAARRQVSGERPPPPIPDRHPRRRSLSAGMLSDHETERGADDVTSSHETNEMPENKDVSNIKIDVPVSGLSDGLTNGLDKEFDRLLEAQKKGYLMRQNTKVVVASSRKFSDEEPPIPSAPDGPVSSTRGTRSAGNSPRKASSDKGPTWTAEPWNGRIRRKSLRQTSGGRHAKAQSGPAPPLPGQESNVATGLGTLVEDVSMSSPDEPEEGIERGRLFVKVVGVKDLDLPLPQNEHTWFQLTLDNGLHCVTTAWLELGKSAPIGQEFELVVLNDLEFQLTLQAKLEPPVREPVAQSPTKPLKPQKASAFSRFLASPKKRKEQERKQQEEQTRLAQQKRNESEVKRNSTCLTAWDLLHELVGSDGSFARAYVCLKNHERQAYGRPYSVDVPCFNEWALEDSTVNSSVKSKRGGVVRRPPYRIGTLELQLLYVPKPKGVRDEDMPKSMSACMRAMKEAEASMERRWEGHLSQQGGDCPYWRRRFFRLSGSKLTAYHEATHQPRATINLAKASKVIDDRSQLTQKETSSKGGGRRKSAFAEEEEGYMFVEEGFRIRFANGETIDFYADSAAQKDDWMKVLSETIGKEGGNGNGWTDMVLAKERTERAATSAMAAAQAAQAHAQRRPVPPNRGSSRSVPSSPTKAGNLPSQAPAPVEKSPRHRNERKQQERKNLRGQVRSMVF